jgi:predicted transcriptional regulator
MASLANKDLAGKDQMKTSQAWSMDIMIAMVIFIGVIFVFYSILSTNGGDKTGELKDDALIIAENINITKNISYIEELLGEDYSELKKKLRVKNEFCIFIEDEEGNVIYLSQDQPGIGSGKINISDVPCG